MDDLLLSINRLSIAAGNEYLVKNLDLSLRKGQTVGIVGESGSGKSLTSMAVMGLLPDNLKATGEILFDDKNLLKLDEEEFRNLRGNEIAMIFQEPMTALNPTMICGKQVLEMIRRHKKIDVSKARQEVVELFKKVELPRPESIYNSYPHQISGGQKQRVVIAMAIACNPRVLIADEPTTALDATVQHGILDLLNRLRNDYGMGMIFISHDLGVVKDVADEIVVLYKGETREYGPSEEIFNRPRDPYTKGLLACRPTPGTSYVRLPVVSDFLKEERPKLKILTPELRIASAEKLMKQKELLKVSSLDKIFRGKSGMFSKPEEVHALSEVALKIYPGESLGLVGESGSGKTTLGRILCGLEKATEGQVFYKGKDITGISAKGWRQLHREIQIIFQDPFTALNPRIKIGEAIAEAMINMKGDAAKNRKQKARELLVKVGLTEDQYNRYPHEFSGGQRQRIGIARALAMNPEFIVCDESVSALDVSVQAQILNLLNDLKDEYGFTYLFISHDLAVVKYFCDRIVVLKNGQLLEEGLADELYQNPKMDYTKSLISASKF